MVEYSQTCQKINGINIASSKTYEKNNTSHGFHVIFPHIVSGLDEPAPTLVPQ